jgi:type II secretory pathway component PulF
MPSSKQFAALCGTFATMLEAGVPIERVIQVAGEQGRSAVLRRAMADCARRIKAGSSLADALKAQRCMPALLVNLADVGERSGSLERVFRELAALYEFQSQLWRRFFGRLVLPALQYVVAVFVASLAFHIFSTLNDGPPRLALGLALGYGIPAALVLFYLLVVKPLAGARACHEVVLRIPFAGGAARALALARFSLVMHLMLEAAVPMRETLEGSFNATGNGAFAARGKAAADAVLGDATLTRALADTGLFPRDYLEIVAVGEETGTFSERFDWLAKQYGEKAETTMIVLATVAARAIWLIVAAFIVFFIFVMFSRYVAILDGAGL